LHQHGYATAIISSQNEAWGAMDQFLTTQGLDWFYHPETSTAPSITSQRDPGFRREQMAGTLVAGKFADRHTTDVAIGWISSQTAAGRPFYVSMNLQSSHFPYLIPDDSPRSFQPCKLDADIKFSSYPPEKVPIVRNAYYNAIQECDRQVGRLVEHLKQLGVWNETILLVTGENGESFHENGCVGHACDAKEPVIHVAAVLNAPGLIEPCKDDYPFEHVDVAPTILGLLGVPGHPNFQGIDALAAKRTPASERLLFFHVISPIAKGDAVSLAGRWKYLTSQDQPQGVLFDLASDPNEAHDASESHPLITTVLRTALKKWRRQQLAYYHFSMYYASYYPPQPPKLGDVCIELGISVEEVLAAVEFQ
jgi:arylsulfatase A-like enzyme